MPNTTITQWGLDYASSASPSGTLIAPLYWVPVYDSRIDGLIHSSDLPVSAFSACVNVSATAPTGEIIWNVNGISDRYALSDNDKVFILSGSGTVSANSQTIASPIQSQQWQINELNGTPLAPHFSATEATFNPANTTWITSAAFAEVAGDNTPILSGKDKYFRVIDYYPVSADAGDSRLRGMVKCRLAKDIGTVKFNKVALYINKFNASGVESPDEPVLFAECQLKTTVIKTSMGTNGFDDVVVDVQIDLHSIEANWNDVFFSTSGDYWSRVPDGVYYPERVGIGSFIDSVLSPQASLHVRRTRAMVSLGITEAPIARFDFNDTNYHQIDISDTGLVHQTFESDYGHLGLYFQPLDKTIYPDVYDVSLGADEVTKRFGAIFLDQRGINISDSSGGGYLKAYFSDDAGYILASDNMSMTFETLGALPAFDEISYIEGADIRKRSGKLVNYTFTSENGDDYIVMAGIDESNSQWYSIEGSTSQYGVTHNNILYLIDTATMFDWISSTGKVKIYGRGEIALNGPVMLDAFVYTDDHVTKYTYGALLSAQRKTLLATGLSVTPRNAIIAADEADSSDNPSTAWANIVSSMTSSGEYQILGRIRHSEDLRPLISDTSIMGVPGLLDYTLSTPEQTAIAYKELYVTQIGSYYGKAYGDEGELAYADNRISTIYAKDIGTTESAGGWARIHRMAMVGLINSGYGNTIAGGSAGFDLGYITSDPSVGDAEYPQNGTAYPTAATHPAYYGLWPKSYMVLGNRADMLATVIPGESVYPTGKSTIDFIATRFMSMTNTLEFVEAFKIQGKYNTIPINYFPGQDPSTYLTEVYPGDSITMAGIHKTGTVAITLGDYEKAIDYAYIDNITAKSLTLTGALTVGGLTFAKTFEWAPDQNTTDELPYPAPITDGEKSSIITDVIKMPTNAVSQNHTYIGGSATPRNTVCLYYQFTNRVVTGYLDMITQYTPSGSSIIRPIYNSASPSCEFVYNNNNITAGAGWFWKADQTLTFTDTIHDMRAGAGTISKIFNVGQYVVITPNALTPQQYMNQQHYPYENTKMMYGIVTDYTSSPYSLTIRIIYYRVWTRNASLYPTAGSLPLVNKVNIITAMPFLLPAPNNRIYAASVDGGVGVACTRKQSRRFSTIAGTYSSTEVKGVCFSDIGIDATTAYLALSESDTIQQFTYLTIKPDAAHSIDLAF